jgi:hypothetical protein
MIQLLKEHVRVHARMRVCVCGGGDGVRNFWWEYAVKL